MWFDLVLDGTNTTILRRSMIGLINYSKNIQTFSATTTMENHMKNAISEQSKSPTKKQANENKTSCEEYLDEVFLISHLQGNPTIFIESTIHSREWIAVATATYLLNELLTSQDVEIRNLVDSYDWVIVPVANVDGYVYTHQTVRLFKHS